MMRASSWLALGLLVWPLSAHAAAPPPAASRPTEGWALEDALAAARAGQPRLAQSRAAAEAASARIDQVQASRQPQLSASSGYSLTPWASTPPAGTAWPSVGLGASWLLADFGASEARVRSAQAQAESSRLDVRGAELSVAFDVRTAYFSAQAAQAMVEVAQEALGNQQRHDDQVSRFVQIGSRAPIDLALSRRDLADARVQLIRAQGDDAVAKARLAQAVGIERDPGFRVNALGMPVVTGEELPTERLLEEALAQRPDAVAFEQQRLARQATLDLQRQAWLPQLRANAGVEAGGRSSATSVPAGTSLGLSLSWPLWNGGAQPAQVAEAEASLAELDAQRQLWRLQVRQEIEQARQAIRAGQEAVKAAAESVRAAREQLTLAEGRYEAGVGNVIELSDAQLGLVRSRGQEAQQRQALSNARAQLLKALGRS